MVAEGVGPLRRVQWKRSVAACVQEQKSTSKEQEKPHCREGAGRGPEKGGRGDWERLAPALTREGGGGSPTQTTGRAMGDLAAAFHTPRFSSCARGPSAYSLLQREAGS